MSEYGTKDRGKKKVLVTASTFPRWEGDTEPRFVLDLAKAMQKYYDITVLVPAAPGAKEKEVLEGVPIVRYHYFPIHAWETLCYPGAIVPRIREKKSRILLVPFLFLALYVHLFRMLPQYDMVHAHWLIPQGIVQSFFKKPYIVTGHGGDVVSLNQGVMRKLKIRCLRRAARVTVVSNYLKDRVEELYPVQKLDVISMGCDINAFSPQYRIPDYFKQGEKKVVLFVGRLAEQKGVKYLVKAMQRVDALLVIVGDGPLRDELKKQAEKLKISVNFLGAKTHEELKEIYASADIFAAPSVTAKDGGMEGFGLVILEAMASGLPVIASRSGGIVEIIKHGENGLLCEERNVEELRKSIWQILKDDDMAGKLRKKSIQTAKKYGYDEIGKRYRDFWETSDIWGGSKI